jgi:hypothetical protein
MSFWKSSGYLYSSEKLGKFSSQRYRFFIIHRIERNYLYCADVQKDISTALHGDALDTARAAEWQPDLHLFRAVNRALSDDWDVMNQ